MKTEILPLQVWKSKYSDIYYKIFGGSSKTIEMYSTDNIWECIVVTKDDLVKHFTLIE